MAGKPKNNGATLDFQSQLWTAGDNNAFEAESDRLVYGLYGLTEGGLDFIINYDIKYKMGSELEEGDE